MDIIIRKANIEDLRAIQELNNSPISFNAKIRMITSGTTIPNTTNIDLKHFPFFISTPLKEIN